ncbi:hypothetical protein [Pontibacter indicus]|uniref:hypothetical protein n=1 Tax=Pontibacter indicus TaxID=1317125 RepID=UPI00147F3A83|nr:hypothetical protein [Pontibacter indicus]
MAKSSSPLPQQSFSSELAPKLKKTEKRVPAGEFTKITPPLATHVTEIESS